MHRNFLNSVSEENITIEDLVDDFVAFFGAGTYRTSFGRFKLVKHGTVSIQTGQETTASLLCLILVKLHEHPDVQER